MATYGATGRTNRWSCMSVDHGAVRGTTTRPTAGGDTLDLVNTCCCRAAWRLLSPWACDSASGAGGRRRRRRMVVRRALIGSHPTCSPGARRIASVLPRFFAETPEGRPTCGRTTRTRRPFPGACSPGMLPATRLPAVIPLLGHYDSHTLPTVDGRVSKRPRLLLQVSRFAMPRTSEVAFNSHLAEALRGKHPLWRNHLGVEQTGVFPDAPRLRPDILVQPPDAQPVVVETEYAPAATVEKRC